MSARRYVRVPYPWRAAIDVSSPAPARFYVRLVVEGLRQPDPGQGVRRLGERLARGRPPEGAAARVIAALPRRPDPELDELRSALLGQWTALGTGMPGDPRELTDDLAFLALERSAARTVFAFASFTKPFVVLKLPRAGERGVFDEADALREAEGLGIAPRYLGAVGTAHVQEAIDGVPLVAGPADPARAAGLEWPPALTLLADAFTRLAAHTTKPGRPEELDLPLALALGSGGLSQAAGRRLEQAWGALDGFTHCVLRHGDTSPQNCLYSPDGELAGVVDWQDAWSHAAPGFDVWNAALSYLERGVAATGWSQERVVETFRGVWQESGYWRSARSAGRAAASAAGAAENEIDALELAFFGHRLIERLQEPGSHPTTPRTAARMLEIVCRE